MCHLLNTCNVLNACVTHYLLNSNFVVSDDLDEQNNPALVILRYNNLWHKLFNASSPLIYSILGLKLIYLYEVFFKKYF